MSGLNEEQKAPWRHQRTKSKLRNTHQHTITLGGYDEHELQFIMETIGCGYAEAVRTSIRVYAAILKQGRR